MLVLYTDPVFEAHETPRGHPECPERLGRAIEGVEATGLVARRVTTASPVGADELARVHDPALVEGIAALCAAGGGAIDPDTHVSARSFAAAQVAAGALCAATQAALAAEGDDPARRAFAVVRPPGHHARPARAMGFCLFNNAAVAAAQARAGGVARVAIVDFDVHHGNGTQEIFYRDPSVLYLSLHGARSFPGTGAADETGSGPGLGTTLNVPLPPTVRPEQYLASFREGLERVVRFAPELILVSAGFDAWDEDPLGGLGLHPEHFAAIGAELRAAADATAGGRLVSVLEGGYDLDALPALVGAYVRGVEGAA